jgi:hypothetical protein
MIQSRRIAVDPAVTIKPPFGSCANLLKGGFSLLLADANGDQFDSKRWRNGLDCGELTDALGDDRISNHGHSRHVRRELLEQFQPFPADRVLKQSESGCVAAGPREALGKAGADRVDDRREYDRNGPSLPLQRDQDRSAGSQNDVGSKRDQLRGVSSIALGIGGAPTGLDPHIAAVRATKLLKPLHERGHAALRFRVLGGEIHQHTDAPHPLRLLRARRQRPR